MLFRNIIITDSYVLFFAGILCVAISRFNFRWQCSFKPLAVSSSLTRITRVNTMNLCHEALSFDRAFCLSYLFILNHLYSKWRTQIWRTPHIRGVFCLWDDG